MQTLADSGKYVSASAEKRFLINSKWRAGKSSLFIVASLFSLALTHPRAGSAEQTITELRAINTDTALAEAAIVYPGPPEGRRQAAYRSYADPDGTSAAYAALAARVAEAVERAGGARLPLIRADEYAGEGKARNLIVLGRMNNNAVAFDLYLERLIAADDWFPGPGGFVVRTVTDPWGKGANVILLGGSDIRGVEKAVEYFISIPELAEGSVPRQWKIDFEGLEEHAEEFARTLAPYYDGIKDGYVTTCHETWRAAKRYFMTGMPEYIEAFQMLIRRAFPRRQLEKYRAAMIGPLYAAIEDSPHLSDEFRLEMVNYLHDTFQDSCRHGYMRNWNEGELRGLHVWNRARVPVSRAAYFRRYYGDVVDFSAYDAALVNIRTGLEAVSRDHNLFREEGGYTHYGPTIVMRMFLKFGLDDFFTSGNSARYMEFLIQMTDNSGRRGHFSGLGSRVGVQEGWLYPLLHHLNPEYMWVAARDDLSGLSRALEPRLEPGRLRYRSLWTFIPRLQPQVPGDEMTGIMTTGISEVAYPESGSFIPPRQRAFRILAMRSGYDFGSDQYLRMYGTDRDAGGSQNRVTVLQHGHARASETFGIRANGNPAGFGPFSDLRVAAMPCGTGFVRSAAVGNEAEWAREIIWRSGSFWLITDRIAIRRESDYRITSDWSGNGLNVRRSAGEPDFSGPLSEGDEYVSVSLISPGDGFTVRRINDGLHVIESDEGAALAGSAPLAGGAVEFGAGVAADSDLFYVSGRELSFGGFRSFGLSGENPFIESDSPVALTLYPEDGLLRVEAVSPIRLTFSGAGPADGGNSAELGEGSHELRLKLGSGFREALDAMMVSALEREEAPASFESEQIKYRHTVSERWRFETGVSPQVIIGADLNGDGREEVLAGLEDGRLLKLSPKGKLAWEFQADGNMSGVVARGRGIMGATPHGINAIAAADLGAGMRVLATSTDGYVYCLDAATGELDWKFTGKSLDLDRPAGPMHGVRAADISGDGRKEVLAASHASGELRSGWLWVLDGSGEPKWHKLLQWGTYPSRITVFDEDDDGRWRVAVSAHGAPHGRQVYIFNHDGSRVGTLPDVVPGTDVGRYHYADAARLGHGGAERLVSVNLIHGNRVRVFDPSALDAPLWYHALDDRPTEFAVADMSGDGNLQLVIGHRGGIFYCLSESEDGKSKVDWRINLREEIGFLGNSNNPIRPVIETASMDGGGRTQLIHTAGKRLFIIDGDGTPLVREEPLADVSFTDAHGERRASGSAIGKANLDGGGRESAVLGAAVRHRRPGHGFGRVGLIAAFDLE